MSDLELMRVLAAATAALAAPNADPGVVERVLDSIPAQADLRCALRIAPDGLAAEWDAPPSPSQEAFVDALGQVVSLALTAVGQGRQDVLDPAAFGVAAERAVASARWRGSRLSIAVFEVLGLALGPGIDESPMVARVGAVAHSVVRQDDMVGHLGAARFALLLPGGGTFEARAAFKRVRVALAEGGDAPGVECGVAGFAELEPGMSGGSDLLGAAIERQADARRRSAYVGPIDPLHPMAG